MFRRFLVSLITICVTAVIGCKNASKDDKWMDIQQGYAYKITKTDLPKDDVFRIVKITSQENNHTVMATDDSAANFLKLFFDANPVITKWKNDLPKGISGQLRLDVDAITKEMMENIAVQVILPTHYDTSHLTSDTSWLAQQPFCKNIEYISKEKARETFIKNGGTDFQDFLDSDTLPLSFNFYLTPAYAGTEK